MPPLPPDFITRATQIVQPFMTDPDEREAYLTQAFYLRDPNLYQMERTGSAMVFTTRCIMNLVQYGCFLEPERQHSLSVLAGTLRQNCGPDKHVALDRLAQEADAACPPLDQAPPPAAAAVAPPAPTLPLQSLETPIGQRTATIFISYSHQDAEFARTLIADLQAAGHAIWVDTTALKGGDLWVKAIAEGIINSYAFILIASRRALQSQYVQAEITWAMSKGKRIVTALLEDVIGTDEALLLGIFQAVKFYEADYTPALAQLMAGLPTPQVLPLAGSVQPTPPPVSPRALELTYLDRLRFEILLNTEKYTPLGGESAQRSRPTAAQLAPVVMRPEYLLLAREGESLRENRRFDNAVEELRRLRRAVVLGEPGAGKTTTLWKLARELVEEAIMDPKAPIPLVIRLGKWTEDEPLERFMARELGEMGRLLPDLLASERAALLLDGLNEIPVSQRRRDRGDKDRQVQALIEAHPTLLAAVSCRERDYTLDLGFDRIAIQPLDALRIREFCTRYLGESEGAKLFWRLAGGEALGVVWSKWEAAGASLKQFFEVTDIPRENPNVYSITSGQDDQLWRERVLHNPGSLMKLAENPYMLSMLAQVYHDRGTLHANRGALFRDFVLTLLAREHLIAVDTTSKQPIMTEAAKGLLAGLARLAYEMQTQRAAPKRREEAEESDAQTALPLWQAQRFLDDQQLYQAGSASLLTVGEFVRFTHQLLQEYFAARHLDIAIRQEGLKAESLWQPDRWWEPTNWEETTILLAGLYSDDCTYILDWVGAANPEVAARCIARGGANTPQATLDRLRANWLPRAFPPRSVGEGPGVRAEPVLARAAIGRALGTILPGGGMLDDRRGVGLGADGLPDLEWVPIDAGTFTYGDKSEGNGPVKTSLESFRISRYPITYAQFQSFVIAADGFLNPLWWAGLGAPIEHQLMPGEQAFRYGNHPRERVSWWDALAFCRWLSARLGYEVRLPTEQEWERAARYTDGRAYPYRGEFDANKGNTGETGIRQTSTVGLFPAGASEEGVLDLSGNVWEWCLNEYSNPANTGPGGTESRVLRGGGWYNAQDLARAASRLSYPPVSRDSAVGFRVVCVPPSQGH